MNAYNNFFSEVAYFYERFLEYLSKRIKPLDEFACFKWMTLSEKPSWNDVEPCLKYLIGKGVNVDDAKCFDQTCNLKQFVESYLEDEKFIGLPTRRNVANTSISLRTSHATQKF